MSEELLSNKRIVKNTIFLYLRMVFMMFIGLFTTRVILKALGVSDLGLMNVASSVVGMFTFLNGTLLSGTMRFITYGIGEGNKEKLSRIFACAMTLHLVFAFIIFFLCETVGLWYIKNHLVCEPGRLEAAMWCFHLSVLSTVIGIILVPFNSALVAHEHMDMYAYMSIYDALVKLLAAYLILITPWDRVIFYSTFTFIFHLGSTYIYNWYCRRHFSECAFRFGYDKEIFKNMLTFSGWNAIGCLADMGRGTGINLVLNAFYGTVVNGAKGIATQANGWVYKFVDSFISAMRPQVTKSYASKDFSRMADLVCNGSSYGAYLYLFLGIPLFIEIEWVLNLWLGECPNHTVVFLRIMMVQVLFQTMGHLTVTAMHATGEMKMVNLTVGMLLLTIVPMGYVLAKMGYSPEAVLAACVTPWVFAPIIRVFLVNKYSMGHFPIRRYIFQVLVKTTALALLMFLPPYYVHGFYYGTSGFWRFLCVGATSVITSILVIYFIGLDSDTRMKVHVKASMIAKQKLPFLRNKEK